MARINGLPRRRVLWRYVLRNALASSIQTYAQAITYLLGGIIVVETLFAYPGVGQLLVQSVASRDLTVVMAVAVILAAAIILLNIVADFMVMLLVPEVANGVMTTDVPATPKDRVPRGASLSVRGYCAIPPARSAWRCSSWSCSSRCSVRSSRRTAWRPRSASRANRRALTLLLGTDFLGRDVLSRVLYGGRSVVTLAGLSTLITYLVGITIGLVAGYTRNWLDSMLMRGVDLVLTFPALLLLLVLISGAGSGTGVLILGTVLVLSPGVARIVRSATLDVSTKPYIEAAVARGENARDPRDGGLAEHAAVLLADWGSGSQRR